METSDAGPSAPTATATPSDSRRAPSRKVAWAAFAFALLGLVGSWIAAIAGPAAARQAIDRGDYDNVFTVLITAWSITIGLDLVAMVLGAIGARRPAGKVLCGVAIGIAATGVLGLLVYLIQIGWIPILL